MKFALASAILLSSTTVLGAPGILTLSGAVSDGEVITITGRDFGGDGPDIQMFDDFELGTNRSYIGEGLTDAQVGQWLQCGAACTDVYYPAYSASEAHGGMLSSAQDWTIDEYDGGRWMGVFFAGPFTEVYISYWVYLPPDDDVPGAGGIGANWKLWWLSTDALFGSDYGLQITSNASPFDMAYGTIDGGEDRCAGTYGVGNCGIGSAGYDSSTFARGRWTRMDFYIHGTTGADGIVRGWLTDSVHPRYTWKDYDGGDNTLYPAHSAGWQHLHIPGYARAATNAITYYDDVYVSVGNGALARIELGNDSTYSSCTNLAVLTPTHWSDTEIRATVRQGSFQNDDTVYVFVVDANNVPSSGYGPLSVGGASLPQISNLMPAGSLGCH